MTSTSTFSSVSTSLPSPYSYSPSQYWDGNDGSWSSFIVRVGSPSQDFRVFPSTNGQETLIPVPEGCTDDDPGDCGTLRGVMPFQGSQGTGFLANESSTWDYIGLYTTNLETNLGIDANGLYGFDIVGLQIENSGGIQQTKQVVAGIADKGFMYGVFGLGPRPSNFSVFSDPQPSFLTTLKTNGTIPSKSFGYTAGASYRYSKVTGSLTLGGYDASRFESGGLEFPFASDDSKPLQVAVTSILATQTLLGPVTLTSDAYFALVDSTVPHIWMPRSACDMFAKAFGLTYDNTTDLYLVNSTMHSRLTSLNPSIVISLSTTTEGGGDSMNIELPYASFDLSASYPHYENSTRYFPIRRAANDTQYTLGRTFLQEAYITADYERSNFTVSQANFSNPMPDTDVRTIFPAGYVPDSSNSSTNGASANAHSSTLPKSEIVGIAIGAAAGACAVVLIGAFWTWITRRNRRRRRRETAALAAGDAAFSDAGSTPRYAAEAEAGAGAAKSELSGGSEAAVSEMPGLGRQRGKWGPVEMMGSLGVGHRSEMFSAPPELEGNSVRGKDGSRGGVFELEGSGVDDGYDDDDGGGGGGGGGGDIERRNSRTRGRRFSFE